MMPRLLIPVLLFPILLLIACQKEADDRVSSDLPIVRDNVIVLDSLVYDLTSSQRDLMDGLYEFSFLTRPDVQNGDIIIGTQAGGFLRKVIDAKVNQNSTMFLQTVPASLEDVFESGSFSFSERLSSQMDGLFFSLEAQSLYADNDAFFAIDSGTFQINPLLEFSFSAEEGTLREFRFVAKSTEVHATLDFTLETASAFEVPATREVLDGASRSFTFFVEVQNGLPIPIPGRIYTDFVLDYSVDVSDALEADFSLTSSNLLSFGGTFNEGAWNDVYNAEPTLIHDGPFLSDDIPFEWEIALYPEIRVSFFNEGGPTWRAKVHEDAALQQADASSNWDLRSVGWLSAELGGDLSVIAGVPSYERTYQIDSSVLSTPFVVAYVSGNQQTGIWTQPLDAPIVTRVLDNLGNPWKNVPVRFQVEQGGGFLAETEVFTDDEGLAGTNWVLGASGLQEVRAYVRRADGSSINGSPVIFKPSGFSNPPVACNSSDLSLSTSLMGNTINATGMGGSPPYLFSLNGMGFQSDNVFDDLESGKTYLVFIKDDEGCVASTEVFVP